MTDNWKEITDPEELFKLKREGWEIEFRAHKTYTWRTWMGGAWQDDWLFQARPRQPKMKKVKLLAFLGATVLQFVREDSIDLQIYAKNTRWIHQPHLDLEGEVPDEQ